MYPIRDIHIVSSIPEVARYWVPKPRDAGDEGFGLNFRDVGVLDVVPVLELRKLLAWEAASAGWVTDGAGDEAEFEERARAVETFDPWDASHHEGLPVELQAGSSLMGLELGVSALSYVMAATGFFPVASCRSHAENSWSPVPTVLFATDKRRLLLLQPLLVRSACGVTPEESRGQPLFAIYAQSIFQMMKLAEELFARRREFKALSKTGRKQGIRRSSEPASKATLFDEW